MKPVEGAALLPADKTSAPDTMLSFDELRRVCLALARADKDFKERLIRELQEGLYD